MEAGLVWTHRDAGLDNRDTCLENCLLGSGLFSGLDNKETGLNNMDQVGIIGRRFGNSYRI